MSLVGRRAHGSSFVCLWLSPPCVRGAGADKNQARKRIECSQKNLGSCIVSVEGFNMNLYERVDQRLAALNECGVSAGGGGAGR